MNWNSSGIHLIISCSTRVPLRLSQNSGFNNPIYRIRLEYSFTSTSTVLLSRARKQDNPKGLTNIVKSPRETKITKTW